MRSDECRTNLPDLCMTPKEYLPTEEDLESTQRTYFLLGAYDDDPPDPLGAVFLQRLILPMVVDSEKAGRKIRLPDLASVYRWAATEFCSYEVGYL